MTRRRQTSQPGSTFKTHPLKLLLSFILMATTILMTRATNAGRNCGREFGRFRRASSISATSGKMHLLISGNRKRMRNRKYEFHSVSGTTFYIPRISKAAFVQTRSRPKSLVVTPALKPSTPTVVLQSSLKSGIFRFYRQKQKSDLALFSTSTSEDAAETPVSQNQKTLSKLPVDDSIELSFFDDSEYHVYESEQTIKKSRFIGLARYADDWEDASNFVQHIRNNVHPKARHWCFAYRGSIVGGESDEIEEDISAGAFATSTTITERASDDGEPSGTAGQPILNALITETTAPDGLIDAVVVVVRYSGGIKLGAGGLIRAYGGTARMVLQEHVQHQIEVIPKQKLSLSSIQPKHVGVVYDLAAKHGATVVATNDDYTSFSVTCDSEVAETFKAGMMDATRGSAVIR